MSQFKGIPMGAVTAYGAGNTMSAHLANIEKVSNGFIVRFQKAQKVQVKPKGLEAFGFDDETKELMRIGLEKLKEGESWKNVPDEMQAALKKAPAERWITVSMAVACKDEKELLEAIRMAVVAHQEIEKLMLDGDLLTGGYL